MNEGLEHLLKRLQAGDRNVRRTDLRYLSDLNRTQFALFCDVWPDVPAGTRLSVISALAQMAEDNIEYNFDRIFRKALSDPDPHVRAKAIQGLWECEDETLVGPFLRLLERDPDEGVRAAAASGLGRFVYLAEVNEIDPAIGTAIESALFTVIHNPDESLEVRRRAVEALAFSGNPDVLDVIRDAYEHENPRMKVSALFAMGRSADRRWRKIVMRELHNPDNEIRFEAVRACGELELQEAVRALAGLLDREEDAEIRQAAVWSLGQAGGEVARKLLERIIESGDEALYDTAQDALEQLSFMAECPEITEWMALMEQGEAECFDIEDDEDEFYDEWEYENAGDSDSFWEDDEEDD